MKGLLALAAAALVSSGGLAVAENWTGEISDSMCRAKHEAPAEGGPELTSKECTLACVRGGSKFVLVTESGTYTFADQTAAALEEHAGETVTVTGELEDGTLSASKIEPAS
jgi:hypothetical protein